jgi:hypothetical protein
MFVPPIKHLFRDANFSDPIYLPQLRDDLFLFVSIVRQL